MRLEYFAIRHIPSGLFFPLLKREDGLTSSRYEFPIDISEKFPPRLFHERRFATRFITDYCKGRNYGLCDDQSLRYRYEYVPTRIPSDFEIITLKLEPTNVA